MSKFIENRRKFLKQSGLLLGSVGFASFNASKTAWAQTPAIITSESERPQLSQGLQFGDVNASNAMVWSRSNKPSRMLVQYSYHEDFRHAKKIRGPLALDTTDFTARLDLSHLKSDRKVYVKVQFQGLTNERALSESIVGEFKTAPRGASRDIHFLWSGDTAGQGWGINPEFGGMRIYESMRQEDPDFFIHCGDTIYADGPITEYQDAENGMVWHNLVTEEVSKVAETLKEYRGRYKYNLMDHNMRAFNAQVPQIWQWDDHEVVNNWSDSKDLTTDDRYTEKNIPLLIARGATAFKEFAPMRPYNSTEQERVYRRIPYGDLLDVLVIDMRSYRGANSSNNQPKPSAETRFLGDQQLAWLKHQLLHSKSVWKVIASDMPIGLIVRDGEAFENMANSDGEPLGRELEMANLLKFIKRHRIKNVVWLTADVHYCAAHHYSPENAVFKHFDSFWEFVAGPLNAGSFGPNQLDNTFGPKVVFEKSPEAPNWSPFAGFQFYGDVLIDKYSGAMTVSLKDIEGTVVFSKTLTPERHHHRRRQS